MRSKIAVGASIATSALVLFGGLAAADNFIADADGIAQIANSNLAMGQVCATDGDDGYNGGNDQPVRLYLERSGNTTNNPDTVWGNNTAVGLSQAETHAAIDVTMPSPSSITTPGNWTHSAGGTTAGPAIASVRVETETLGALTGTGPQRKITISASGNDAQATPQTLGPKTRDVEVTATIVNDASATSVDCKLPTAAITIPADGGEYELGSDVDADYSCNDPAGAQFAASGIKSTGGCVGTDPDGNDIDTGTLGQKTFTVVATDNAGNRSSTSVTYTVIEPTSTTTYSATFGQPLDGGGVINKGKFGRVIPVKVQIAASDNSAVSGPVYWGAKRIPCTATSSDAVETYLAAGSSNLGNTFRPADGGWIYNLDTSKLGSVNQCFELDAYVGGTVVNDFASGGVPVTNGTVKIQLVK